MLLFYLLKREEIWDEIASSFHSLAMTKMDSLFRGNDKEGAGMTDGIPVLP